MDERFYSKYALAVIRGRIKRLGIPFDNAILEKELDDLSDSDCKALFDIARENEIKLYHFKKSDRTLPRVVKVLGFLKSLYFESLLDVGSGRGVFLLPLLEELPHINVTSLEILEKRVLLLSDIANGGANNLTVVNESICDTSLPEKSFDVVTMLEVLEHIYDVESAIKNAVRLARHFVVVTVPSKEDDNPEHIHLLTKDMLTKYFNACGVTKLSFDGVPGHLFMIGRL